MPNKTREISFQVLNCTLWSNKKAFTAPGVLYGCENYTLPTIHKKFADLQFADWHMHLGNINHVATLALHFSGQNLLLTI
jgi:hypothetical protein